MISVDAPDTQNMLLETLLDRIDSGEIQLPEFQRDWTWDDNRIRELIASIIQRYPMGAIMSMEYGTESCHFQFRPVEGVSLKNAVKPGLLILDGQQRLTSIYRAAYSRDSVKTKNDKGTPIEQYYYLDMNACLDPKADMYDAVVSVPKSKIKIDYETKAALDLSTRELEYKNEMFPLNLIFSKGIDREDWFFGYCGFYNNEDCYRNKYMAFRLQVVDAISKYEVPVIKLSRNTPREAVCKVFENVNTGGVSLTVFELLTATYAADSFNLRDDWEMRSKIIWGTNDPHNITDVMTCVDETAFLTSVTLLASYESKTMTTCKKKDVLALPLEDYKTYSNKIIDGYKRAKDFILTQYIYRKRDLPYPTQLIPLSAICAVLTQSEYDKPQTKNVLSRWFWCGIFGEMYGGANETRYANDIEDVLDEIKGRPSKNRTVNAAFFSSTRLLTLTSRLSSAYKGIMALLYKKNCLDFMLGISITNVIYMEKFPDIHHIFPEAYCIGKNYPREKWNSVVNKTPLLRVSNQQIGGTAPSVYSKKIMAADKIDEDELRKRVESNLIDYDFFIADNFDEYFIDRAKRLLNLIEEAMGKKISDRSSEETIKQFGVALV